MKIENQVCTLEQAKKLKELGIKQRSFFGYIQLEKTILISRHTDKKELAVYNTLAFENISAFTVAELGVMLCGNGYLLPKTQAHFGWLVIIENKFYPTEAQARAAMAIHLLTNKIITAQEVNERLLQS